MSEEKKRKSFILLLIFLCYYILAGCAFMQFQKKDNFFHFPQVDEKTNLERAELIVKGELSKKLFWQEPAAFLYFSLLNLTGIDTPLEIKFFQLFFLNPVIILMIYLLGRMLFKHNRTCPLIAAALYAFSPLPFFLSLTIMKTIFTIFIYILCFFFYFKFYRHRSSLKYGLFFVFTWFISWWTRQHMLLLLPLFFIFLSLKRKSPAAGKGKKVENRNVLIAFIIIIVLIISSLSVVTIANKKQMLTLTTNGAVNFYIANNINYEETSNIWPGPQWQFLTYKVDHLVNPYAMITEHPLKWIQLLAQKSLREFTPYADFRQFHWGYYENLFPYFKLSLLFNLVLVPLVVIALLQWPKLRPPYRLLGLSWLVYHGINIILIPGIARYNAVILPLTIILAIESLRLIIANKKKKLLVLLPVLAVLLVFIKNPNDFKQEYHEYLTGIKKLENREKTEIIIPAKTRHPIEWKYLKARYELEMNGNYREVIKIIESERNFAKYSSDFARLLDFSFMKLGLYYDALKAHEFIQMGNYTRSRLGAIQSAIIFKTEAMLQSYRREKLLNSRKANSIAVYLATMPVPGTKEAEERFARLLLIAEQLVNEAIEESHPQEKGIYLDTLGIIYARRGLKEKSMSIFREVYDSIQDPLERAKYKKRRNLPF